MENILTIEATAVILFTIWFLCLIMYFIAVVAKDSLQRGSHPRYIAASLVIAANVGIILCVTGIAALTIYRREYGSLALQGSMALLHILLIVSNLDDDNWFKKQFRRLKQGFKKFRSIRINIRKPVLASPPPAPTLVQ